MTNMTDTRRPPGRIAEQHLRTLRKELRTRQAERKAWQTGAIFGDHWGIPWCAIPGGDHCQGTGCEGCHVAAYCRRRAEAVDTFALEQAISASITPEEKEAMTKLKEIGDRIRGDLDAAQAAGRLPAVRLAVRLAQSKKTGPTATITVTGHETLVGHPDRFPKWSEYQGEILLAQIDQVANRDGRDVQLGGITKFGTLK